MATHKNLGRQEWPKNLFQYFTFAKVLTGPLSSGGSSVVMRNYLAPVTNFRQIIYGTIKLQGVLCSSISQMRFSLSLILAPLALAAPHLEKRLDFTSHCGQWECVK